MDIFGFLLSSSEEEKTQFSSIETIEIYRIRNFSSVFYFKSQKYTQN